MNNKIFKNLSLHGFLDLDMAVAYWNLVLTGRFKFLDLWNRFLLVRADIFVMFVFRLLF